MDKEKILVIDDEPDMLSGCQKFLEASGYTVVIAESGEAGLALFETENPDLVIVDLKMPRVDGMAVLQNIMARDQEAVVIVFTGYGTIEGAVEAIKAGAFDFIQKVFDPEEFLIVIERALKLRRARLENRALKQMLDTRFRFENIIGSSEAITQVFDLIRKIGNTSANVLITGRAEREKNSWPSVFMQIASGATSHLFRSTAGAYQRIWLKVSYLVIQRGIHRRETEPRRVNRTREGRDIFSR